MKTLILYSTVDGQTKKICQYIADEVKANSNKTVEMAMLSDFAKQPNFADYDDIIIGASIRYGKHRKYVQQFIEQYKTELATKNTAFFSVNLVARKPEKNTATTSPYMIKFLQTTDWQPTLADVFAGQLDYARYGIFDKIMIKFIMWVTKGPTKSDKPIEFTDWQRVKAFSDQVAAW
ncbi:menaquinone-dependent protoporphyrinogen IX dehydrogenase [Psychrobacter sp. HD31]|uniref:menaquinone-dependent protoporphyrinogen IX dehydrogenase n=1 Tax=Psychrobacter sp. HD31 TaxID=3112003 RepID=UPI003DA4BABD